MSTQTLRNMSQISELMTGSEINLVKMTAQDFEINGNERVLFLNFVCDNRYNIFGGSDPVVTAQLIRKYAVKFLKA